MPDNMRLSGQEQKARAEITYPSFVASLELAPDVPCTDEGLVKENAERYGISALFIDAKKERVIQDSLEPRLQMLRREQSRDDSRLDEIIAVFARSSEYFGLHK